MRSGVHAEPSFLNPKTNRFMNFEDTIFYIVDNSIKEKRKLKFDEFMVQ